MKKFYFGLAALLFMAAGCSNDDFTDNGASSPEGQKRSLSIINASIAGADTRTDLVDGNKLVWLAGDHISVFSDDPVDGWITRFDITDGVGTSTATFKGVAEVKGSEFYAFYPGTIFKLNQEVQLLYFNWNYDVIFSSDPSPMQRSIPMFAKGTGENFVFQKLAGLLHFKIKGKGSLIKATLRDNAGVKFDDYFTVDYGGNNMILNPMDDSGLEDYITGTPSLDTPLSDTEAVDIYFSLPANKTFENGFSLELEYYDENKIERTYTHQTEKEFVVKAGEVSTFPAIVLSSTGGSEEPEFGWETNFFDLSGKDVDVSYYFSYDKTQIFWSLIFKTEDNADPIYLDFWMDYKGGNPELSWLSGIVFDKRLPEFADFRFHDFKTGSVYMLNLAESLTISENTDGTWSLRLKNVTLENNDDHTLLYNINLKFDGYFNFIPLPTWNFSGAAWMSGSYTSATMEVEDNTVKYQIRFLDFPWGDGAPPSSFHEVMFKFRFVFEGDTPSFPTNAIIDDFYLDIFSQGYDWTGVYVKVDDDAVVTIYQNEDGAYEITIKGVKMYPVDEGWETNMAADPIISDFSFVGELEFEPGAIGGI